MSPHRDERGILLSWLAKIVVGIAMFGVIAYDGGSILFNYFTLDSAADDLALALSLAIETDDFGTNDEEVFEGAKTLIAAGQVDASGARVVRNGTGVDEEGIIHVKLKRVASTIVVERIAPLQKWARATGEGQASTR